MGMNMLVARVFAILPFHRFSRTCTECRRQLLVTSTRDLLLSNTTIFHRALLHADNHAQLVVFEALPRAFCYQFQLPEPAKPWS